MNYAPEPSGTAPFTTDFAEHLASRGHTVQVVTGLPHYPEWRVRPECRDGGIEQRNGVTVLRVRHFVPARQSLVSRLRYELSFALRSLPALVRTVRRADVVVAVIPGLFSAVSASLICSVLGKPFVVWSQDSMTRGASQTGLGAQGLVTLVLSSLESFVFNTADRVIVISETFAERLGSPGVGRIAVVRNWTFLPEADRPVRATRRALQWPDSQWVALHAGNMGLKQGLSSVVEAARTSDASTRYVLLGAGSQLSRLRQSASGVQNLEFLPSVDNQDYVNILGAADALILCEKPDVKDMSLPSKLTAYARAGRPIVAFVDPDGATARELRSACCGVVVDNRGRPETLDAAIQALRGDRELCQRLVENGRRYAEAEYGRRANMAKLQSLVLAAPVASEQ
ncbi:glycosyltransferase family 4 protein [Nocardioides coralli]|uniref:glycosyltransferase family 4 protein n=1 Tax=Nocardioides coralli TaxID=2872154 RepID=UPI001CA3EB44|nr:glycosyltransferase family 4 protein [Nocardioides coralli]QZY28785.1 glycosyltransferase family 4 protein [Nocardioides coralli]